MKRIFRMQDVLPEIIRLLNLPDQEYLRVTIRIDAERPVEVDMEVLPTTEAKAAMTNETSGGESA